MCGPCRIKRRYGKQAGTYRCYNKYYEEKKKFEKKRKRVKVSFTDGTKIPRGTKEALFEQQGGRCAICKEDLTSVNKAHLDHCHKNKTIRGLLCTRCNLGLGLFDDDVTKLQSAIEYLACQKLRCYEG